ncbi:MAG: HalOD1 output domain-containing protein [Halobacteriota archaeon]
MNHEQSTSETVVQTVAAHEGIDPVQIDTALQAVIDTDALDALFESTTDRRTESVTVEFAYRGHTIAVDAAGRVDVIDDAANPRNRPSDTVSIA